jgi:hypothetical protein
MVLRTKPRSRTLDTPSEADSETQTITENELFHLLQTSRRREVIRYLLNTDGPVQIGDIAKFVAATEHETSPAKLTTTQRQRVYIPLYQSHLPKLDECGVIEYDQSRGLVWPTSRLKIFRQYLEPVPDNDNSTRSTLDFYTTNKRESTDLYIAAAGLSGLLLSAVVMEILFLPGVVLGGIIIALFLLVTIVTD